MKFAFALVLSMSMAWVVNAAPNFMVKPYLQNPSTNAMSVYVETLDLGVKVHYRELGKVDSFDVQNMSRVTALSSIRSARITGLKSNTRYEYYVSTLGGSSDVFRFKTWPKVSDNTSDFKILAFSDSQGQHADRLADIVNNGMVPNDCNNNLDECDNAVAAILVPGDLVQTGGVISQWRKDFFGKAAPILARVPVIPAIGNHDYALSNFINYFEFPENGYKDYNEQWYYADYLNFRLITLNSNSGINDALNNTQRQWLDNLLSDTANSDDIDYVMLQIHHPCKSEMWLPGEKELTCEYVRKFENVSAQTGKITGHVFGHTHAYSRGQSRDVSHIWLNAAVSSGDIDYWDEFPQADYDEFQKSYPEYGYSSLVFGVDQKRLSVKRYSGGDGRDNYWGYQGEGIRDDFTIAGNNSKPDQPTASSPSNESIFGSFTLIATPFADADNDSHLEAHWQVSSRSDFATPELDFWGNKTRSENIWKYENTQAGVVLSEYNVNTQLPAGRYFWRVRYRDEHWDWSDWSNTSTFNVAGLTYSANLLQNPGAEEGMVSWTVETGVVESNASNECNGVAAQTGSRYFSVGGICDHSVVGQAMQLVDLSEYADEIATAQAILNLSAYTRDWNGSDVPEVWADVYDVNGQLLVSSNVLSNAAASWANLETTLDLPVTAVKVIVRMKGTRTSGEDNDSYVDSLVLRVGYAGDGGQPITTSNLIVNPGAENDLSGWSIDTGVVESQTAGACDGASPQEGNRYFVVGGLCAHSEVGQASQVFDFSTIPDLVSAEQITADFSVWMRNWSGHDLPESWLEYLDDNQTVISRSNALSHNTSSWTRRSLRQTLPQGTKFIRVIMKGTRNRGTDNDSYFDNLSMTLTYQ